MKLPTININYFSKHSFFLGLLFLFAIYYASHNNHGHSSLNPLWMIPFFIFILTLSIIYLVKSRSDAINISIYLNVVTCFFGIAFPIFLTKFQILQEKSNWIHSGMPQPPEWTDLFLGTYAISYIVVSIIMSFLLIRVIATKKRNLNASQANEPAGKH